VDAQTFNAPCQQAPVHQLQAFDASLVLDQLKRDPIKWLFVCDHGPCVRRHGILPNRSGSIVRTAWEGWSSARHREL